MSISVLLLILGLAGLVSGHSYMTQPRGRDPWKWNDCRLGGPSFSIKECHSIPLVSDPDLQEAGPCERAYNPSQTHHNHGRGDPIRIEWPRNNHPGGFVRLSWVPTAQSDNANAHQLFDQNVWMYTCFERVCRATPGGNGGDNLGTDGGCWIDTNLPTHLTDGDWTLQWTWYGGMYGRIGDYYTCANFRISGGAALTAQADPIFIGGDAANPNNNDVCQWFTTDRLHYCRREDCLENSCRTNTAPSGNCNGWPPMHGPPYIDARATPVTSTPVTSTPATSTPATSTPPSTSPTGDDGSIRIVVEVTVKVSTPQNMFDISTFVYSLAGILEIPASAIEEVSVDLERSEGDDTYITFTIINAVGKNGVRIDPLAAAKRLQEIAASGNPTQGAQYSIFTGLEVISAETVSSASFATFSLVAVFSAAFALCAM